MINANVHGEHAQGETNASGETGAQLRMRMGANERAFQSRWKRNFGYAFNARRICTPDEVLQVEALYSGNIVRPLRERAANEACDNNKVENPSPNVGAGFLETETVKAVKGINYRRLSLFAAFAAPTPLTAVAAGWISEQRDQHRLGVIRQGLFQCLEVARGRHQTVHP